MSVVPKSTWIAKPLQPPNLGATILDLTKSHGIQGVVPQSSVVPQNPQIFCQIWILDYARFPYGIVIHTLGTPALYVM